LPFNLGNDQGKGNPPNPAGFKTAYFYERVLVRESWLNIVDRFIHIQKYEVDDGGKKRQREAMIFPRYHQWDAVTRLIGAATEDGPGHNYLIQHSAGSGKSNSIMWLAHRLASLHDLNDKRAFDSVIVVTDRNVLDDQLQKTISEYEHKAGFVVSIKKGTAKTPQLVNALKNRTPLLRFYGDAEGEDAGDVRNSRRRDDAKGSLPHLQHAAGHRRGLHPRRPPELHAVLIRLSFGKHKPGRGRHVRAQG
jgi:type I restriction enzyme R subunit